MHYVNESTQNYKWDLSTSGPTEYWGLIVGLCVIETLISLANSLKHYTASFQIYLLY